MFELSSILSIRLPCFAVCVWRDHRKIDMIFRYLLEPTYLSVLIVLAEFETNL